MPLKRLQFVVAGLGFAVGCSSPPTQVITGRIAAGFPAPITSVKVTTSSVQSFHGDARVTTVPVAADGTFRLEVPALDGVRLILLADNGQSSVVFPRQQGGIEHSFKIRASGGAFDLGSIHYVGDATAATFVFKAGAGDGDGECNDDGMDSDGAMCVDDEDEDQSTCGEDDENEQEGEHEDDDDDDDGEQEGDDGDGDGEEDDDGNDPADGPDLGDAVAEHNFPADGCSDNHEDGEQDDDGEHED